MEGVMALHQGHAVLGDIGNLAGNQRSCLSREAAFYSQ